MVSPITRKQDLLMLTLTKYFCDENNYTKILPILEGKDKISLRIIDWFVTNYSKKNNITYLVKNKKNNKRFNVYLDYKSQLKAYSKKQFDPFCRRERIMFYYKEEEHIVTTVGQLNFFRWAMDNNILDYVKKHLKIIEKDMNESIKHIYCNKKIPRVIKKVSKIKQRNKTKRKNKEKMLIKYKSKKRNINGSKRKKEEVKYRKKRKELSKAASKKYNKQKIPIVLNFE